MPRRLCRLANVGSLVILCLVLSGCGALRTLSSFGTQLQGQGPILAQLPPHSDFAITSGEAIIFFELQGATQVTFRRLGSYDPFNVMSYDIVLTSGPGVVSPIPLTTADNLFCIKVREGDYHIEAISVGNAWHIIPRFSFHAYSGEVSYIGTILVGQRVPGGTSTSLAIVDRNQIAIDRLRTKYMRARQLPIRFAIAQPI